MEQNSKPLNLNQAGANLTNQTKLASQVLGAAMAHRVFLSLVIVGFIAGTTINHYAFPRYTSAATLLVQRAENSPLQAMMGRLTGGGSFSKTRNEYLEKYLQYLNSHEFYLAAAREHLRLEPSVQPASKPSIIPSFVSVARDSINRFFYVKLSDPSNVENRIEELANQLHSGSAFLKAGQDNILAQVSSRNYAQAVEKANFLASVAVSAITTQELKELDDAKKYIEREQAATIARLQKSDREIIEFRLSSKLGKAPSEATAMLEGIADLKRNLEGTQLRLEQNQALISELTNELRQREEQIVTNGGKNLPSPEVLDRLREQLSELNQQRTLLEAQGYAENSAQITMLTEQINRVATRINQKYKSLAESASSPWYSDAETSPSERISALKRENQFLKANLNTLKTTLREAMKPLDSLPEIEQKLAGFGRSVQLEYSLLQEMKKKTLEIELERVALDSKVRILEKATIAGIPAQLNLFPKILFSSILALILGTGLCFTFESLNGSVKSRQELVELGMIVVGSVPLVSSLSRWNPIALSRKAIDVLAPWRSSEESPEVLAFKGIRAMVLKMTTAKGKKLQALCVLGATAGDGKSYLSANIGLALGQMGKRTLILDGDLRRPTLGNKLGVRAEVGLTSILVQKTPLEEVINRNVVPNVDVLASGPRVKNATELLSGPEFPLLLDELRAKYDFIVIDTPPLLPIVDGIMLALAADGMLFAVSHRKTKVSDISQALEKIRYFDERPAFAVYNRIERGSQYSYVYSIAAKLQPSLETASLNFKTDLKTFKTGLFKAEGNQPS